MKKKFLLITNLFILLTVSVFVCTSAIAQVPLPSARFTGVFNVEPTNGIILAAKINQVNYTDGTSTNADTAEETIIDAVVTLSNVIYDNTLGGDYFFTNGTLSVSDETGTYLTADLLHVVVTGNYVNFNFDTKNLQNAVVNPMGSRFAQELDAGLNVLPDATKEAAVSLTLELFTGTFDTSGFGNVQGLLDGADGDTQFDADPKTIGFWKHQVNQNGKTQFTLLQVQALINDALAIDASLCDVYGGDANAFANFLTATGKKTMEERAKQQLAALLMNFAALFVVDSVPVALPVSDATTVGEALEVIDCNVKNGIDLETSKTVADLINNGVGIAD